MDSEPRKKGPPFRHIPGHHTRDSALAEARRFWPWLFRGQDRQEDGLFWIDESHVRHEITWNVIDGESRR